jgi:hypothetical protein
MSLKGAPFLIPSFPPIPHTSLPFIIIALRTREFTTYGFMVFLRTANDVIKYLDELFVYVLELI